MSVSVMWDEQHHHQGSVQGKRFSSWWRVLTLGEEEPGKRREGQTAKRARALARGSAARSEPEWCLPLGSVDASREIEMGMILTVPE
jgi:hypothetical protein